MSVTLPERTGTENPATSGQLPGSSKRGDSNNGASLKTGYKVISVPKFEPALITAEHSGGAAQNVKGKHGAKASSEAHPVAGRS